MYKFTRQDVSYYIDYIFNYYTSYLTLIVNYLYREVAQPIANYAINNSQQPMYYSPLQFYSFIRLHLFPNFSKVLIGIQDFLPAIILSPIDSILLNLSTYFWSNVHRTVDPWPCARMAPLRGY